MKKFISNSINMIRTVLNYLTGNPTPTSGIPAFATAKTTVTNKLVLIDSLNEIILGNSVGTTLDTNLIRAAMSDMAFHIGSSVAAYAASANNNTLRLEVNFSRPAFNRLKKDEVDDICQLIHDRGNTHIAAAGAFGCDAANITDLQTAIDLYRTSVQNPRQAIISKTDAIDNVTLLVKEIKDNYFKLQMDKMVNTVIAAEPQFVKSYFLAREIIDLGVTHTKIRGTVKDDGDVPLSGVNFELRNAITNELFAQTLSKAKGIYSISPVIPGDYNLTWSFNGYQTIIENNVHFSAGKELKRNIVMQLVSGITIIREGDIPSPGQVPINLIGVNGTPASMVTIEVTGPAGVRFGAVANEIDPPGPIHFDKETGSITMTLDMFIELCGFGPGLNILVAQNIGMVLTHYKLTFTNLEP
ncbi:MAG: carboxypeptidase-like regulatory domain-containing protein [Bacteroidota bacterium]